MTLPTTSGSLSDPAIVTGDFNNPRFYGRPNRAVTVGERVIAHDGDPTVDDYWATVTKVSPARADSPHAAKFPFGLAHLDVTWEKVDTFDSAQAGRNAVHKHGEALRRLADG